MASDGERGQGEDNPQIFKCELCGDCCRGYGGTYISAEDIAAISDYIDQASESFVEKYCQWSGNQPMLAQGKDGRCIFWDRVCTIHPVKPAMCRAWPYIKSVLIDAGNWHTMATCCPGMRTDVGDKVIQEQVRRKIAQRGEGEKDDG